MTDPKIFEPQEDNIEWLVVEEDPQIHKRLLNTKKNHKTENQKKKDIVEKKPLQTNENQIEESNKKENITRELYKTITLEEEIDLIGLKIIIDNYDKFTKYFIRDLERRKKSEQNGFKSYDINTLKDILITYYNQKLISNKITYEYSKKNNFGRLFSNEWSLQGLGREIRQTIARDIYYDIDMKNAHPVLLLDYCKKNGIKTKYLDYYINNRDKCLKEVNESLSEYILDGVEDAKQLFLMLLNGGLKGYSFEELPSIVSNFSEELKIIRKQICKKEKKLYNIAKKNKDYNQDGTATNYLLCILENQVLQYITKYCETLNIEVGALVFDGLMIYKHNFEDKNGLEVFLSNLEEYIFENLNINLKIVEKEMNEGINLSEYNRDYYFDLVNQDIENKKKELEYSPYEFETEEERNKYIFNDFYQYIQNNTFRDEIDLQNFFKARLPVVLKRVNYQKGFYIKKDGEEAESYNNIIKLKEHILETLQFYYYDYEIIDKRTKIADYRKIEKSKTLNELMRECKIPTYSKVVVRPDNKLNNEYEYNMWIKMKGDRSVEIDMNKINPILEYIKDVIANNNDDVYRYMVSWIRHICKYPHIKTKVVPILYTLKQQTGKGTLANWLIENVFGRHCSTSTTGFDRIVDKFNSLLLNRVFIKVDEASTKSDELHKMFDKMKGLITEPMMDVEQKGMDVSINTTNLLNFMVLTNNKFCMKIENFDKRYFPMYCNENYTGNTEYWNNIYQNVLTEETGIHFFNYLINLQDNDPFLINLRDIPETELKEEMKTASLNSFDLFISKLKNREELGFKINGFITDIGKNKDTIKYQTEYIDLYEYKENRLTITKKKLLELYKDFCSINHETFQKEKYNCIESKFKLYRKSWVRDVIDIELIDYEDN